MFENLNLAFGQILENLWKSLYLVVRNLWKINKNVVMYCKNFINKKENYRVGSRYKISVLVLKNISLFWHSKINFASPRGHVIASISFTVAICRRPGCLKKNEETDNYLSSIFHHLFGLYSYRFVKSSQLSQLDFRNWLAELQK